MTSVGLVLLAAALLLLPVQRSAARLRPASPVPIGTSRTERDSDSLAVAATFDLFAAVLRAGVPTATAAATVAEFACGSMATSLRKAADLLSLGADPAVAWESAAEHPATESFARIARRSARSGTSLSAATAELAANRRAEAEDEAAARAERAGVLISGPLGLCFLPAFVCLGIVPVVIGLAGRVLHGGLV